jgi:hypothetical protein
MLVADANQSMDYGSKKQHQGHINCLSKKKKVVATSLRGASSHQPSPQGYLLQ